jgi:hypothetical protein
MSSKQFHDLLRRARVDLSHEEQLKFIQELTKHASATNGTNGERSLFDSLSEPCNIGYNKYMEGFGQHGS